MMGDSANVSSSREFQPPRPTITVPPRTCFESFFSAGGSIPGYSPGPMTLLSGMFSPDSNSFSFSQLLAGAIASPIPKPPPPFFTDANSPENPPSTENFGPDESDKAAVSGGYKKNRPMGLMVAQSPLFRVPPGLSPSGFLNSPAFLTPLQSPFGMSHQQALAHVTAQAAFSQSFRQMQADYQHSSVENSAETLQFQTSSVANEPWQQIEDNAPEEPQCLKMVVSPEASQSDKKPAAAVFALDKPAADGYNWRKYGQKLVKAKEHPRSYYKCTFLDCPVKKKVERATDGQVTEITYKGQHNHEMPQPNNQAKDGSNNKRKPEFGSKRQTEIDDRLNEVETYDSGARKRKTPTQLPSNQLPVLSENDEMEDSPIVIDDDDDETSAKRRNAEVGAPVLAPSTKTITEPKIVVQTRSEVDLLDDGFKWRKYGQKVVKGNPHPRSYYRCTYAGCNVRKHVERASTDVKSVVTTYEGKHNHDIPIARNNSQKIQNGTSAQSKTKKVSSRKPAAMQRGMDFESKDQIKVFSQLNKGEIAA